MKCFLIPKGFDSINDTFNSKFVLRDKDNNLIHVSFVTSDTKEVDLSLSNRDLRSIYEALSKSFEVSNDTTNDNICSIKDYLIKQDLKFKSLVNTCITVKFPPLKLSLSSSEFYLKTFSDLNNSSDLKLPIVSILTDKRPISDLYPVKEFAIAFKNYRLELGLTQLDVGISMGLYLKTELSQTTVCRFESMALTLTNMLELIPTFRRWVEKIETIGKVNVIKHLGQIGIDSHLCENPIIIDSAKGESSAKIEIIRQPTRSYRTSFTSYQIDKMESFFQQVKFSDISRKVYTKLAQELYLDEKKIKTWIVKRRSKYRKLQQETKRIRKL